MLVSFEGKVGQGKTLSATTFAVLDWLEADRKIVANYNIWLDRINYIYDDEGNVLEEREVKHPKEGDFIKFDYEFFVEAMENNSVLYDTTVVLDEAYLFADSRMSQSGFNKLLSYFVLQTRKRDVDLYLTTQQFENIDRRLRQNTDIRVLCLFKGTGIIVPEDKFYVTTGWRTEYRRKKVELIRVGDEVVSFNPVTSEKELKRVTAVGNRIADELIHLVFSNGNEIRITPEHPFASPKDGQIEWIEAGDLKEGDAVLQYNYDWFDKRIQLLERGKDENWKQSHVETFIPDVEITRVVSSTRVSISTRVYNIEVEDNNNYFAEGLLVHNCRYNRGTKVVTCRFVDLRSGLRRRIKIYGPEYHWLYDTKEIPTLRPGHIRAVQL